jgi:hypothetical protein
MRHLIADPGGRFHDLGPDHYDRRLKPERFRRTHVRALEAQGFTVTLTPAEPASSAPRGRAPTSASPPHSVQYWHAYARPGYLPDLAVPGAPGSVVASRVVPSFATNAPARAVMLLLTGFGLLHLRRIGPAEEPAFGHKPAP